MGTEIRSDDGAWKPPQPAQESGNAKAGETSSAAPATGAPAKPDSPPREAGPTDTYAKGGPSAPFSASASGEGYSKPEQTPRPASADREAVDGKDDKVKDDKVKDDKEASEDASGKAPVGPPPPPPPPPPPATQATATSGSPTAGAPASGLQQMATQSVAAVAQNQLASRLQDPGFMSKTLGPNYDRGQASQLASQFAAGHPMDPSKVQVVDPSKVSARTADGKSLGPKFEGAFDKQSGTMYLSQNLFTPGANAGHRDDVIAQELMHHVAQTVDPRETSSGAEGVIASHELKGTPMTADQVARAQQSGDHGTLALGSGKPKDVAFANPGLTPEQKAAKQGIKAEVRRQAEALVKPTNAAGRSENCTGCAMATDIAIAEGRPVIPNFDGRVPVSQIAQAAGRPEGFRVVGPVESLSNLTNWLKGQPDGTRGIVWVANPNSDASHVLNVMKAQGSITYLDGQIGQVSSTKNAVPYFQRQGWTHVSFLRTTPGPAYPGAEAIERSGMRPTGAQAALANAFGGSGSNPAAGGRQAPPPRPSEPAAGGRPAPIPPAAQQAKMAEEAARDATNTVKATAARGVEASEQALKSTTSTFLKRLGAVAGPAGAVLNAAVVTDAVVKDIKSGDKSYTETQKAVKALALTEAFSAYGASIGTAFFPGIGTFVGGVIGGLGGAGISLLPNATPPPHPPDITKARYGNRPL